MLVDANLLIYAAMRTMKQHGVARAWLDEVLSTEARVAIPWSSFLAFLRVVTNPRLFSPPPRVEDAWQQVREWLAAPPVWTPHPAEHHADILGRMMPHVTSPQLVPDAHLAALALGHGLTIYSADGDFARFPGVRWRNPLA